MSDQTLIEEAFLPDVIVTGIGRIERLSGGLVRITYYSERRNDRGHMEHVAVLRMIRPMETWPQSIQIVARFLSETESPFVAIGEAIKVVLN